MYEPIDLNHPVFRELQDLVNEYVRALTSSHATKTYTAADSFTEVEVDAAKGVMGLRVKADALTPGNKAAIDKSLIDNLSSAAQMADLGFKMANVEMIEGVKKIIADIKLKYPGVIPDGLEVPSSSELN